MKICCHTQTQRALTLPELMITVTVTSMVLAALITTHLFGWRLFEFIKPKLAASDNARRALTQLAGELRSANRIRVGQGSSNTFTEVAFGSVQQGNAIQVYPTTNTTNFARYYYDSADKRLKRILSGSSQVTTVSRSISNQLVFTGENFSGVIQTNSQGNRVIGLTLQFSQIEYPIIKIGTGEFYDYYQLRTKITQRKLPQL